MNWYSFWLMHFIFIEIFSSDEIIHLDMVSYLSAFIKYKTIRKTNNARNNWKECNKIFLFVSSIVR